MNGKQKVLLLVCILAFVICAASGYHFSSTGGSSTFFGFYSGTYSNLTYHTNYLGFISLGIAISTLVGVFLFKGKK
jgi:hypothetical protein